MKSLLTLILAISFAQGYNGHSCSQWKNKAKAQETRLAKSGVAKAQGQRALYYATMYSACESEGVRKALIELIKKTKGY